MGTILTGYNEGSSTGDYQIDRENKKIILDSPQLQEQITLKQHTQ